MFHYLDTGRLSDRLPFHKAISKTVSSHKHESELGDRATSTQSQEMLQLNWS